MNTDNVSDVGTSGTYASKSTMACTYVHIVLGGEEMKKRKKLNFWELLPKVTPWIMAVWALKHSNLNTEQTVIMVVACLVVCFGLQAIAEDFGKEKAWTNLPLQQADTKWAK